MNIFFLKLLLLQVTLVFSKKKITTSAGHEIWNGKPYEVLEGVACLRKCMEPRKSKICEFTFEVSWWHTMTEDCSRCPLIMEDCFNKNCITADGNSRLVQLVNKQLPGPSIQVCEGDVIRVKVENKNLMGAGLSIHWHGIHQRGSPSSDGVPYVTQYYIDSGKSFEYEFVAEPAGTHFWHSHSGMELGDGVGGPLVVRRPIEMEENAHLYDEDLAAHHVYFQTFRENIEFICFLDVVTNFDYSLSPPVSFLVNGKSERYVYEDNHLGTPLTTYKVKPGKRYRFRLIYAGPSVCEPAVYIDQHQMLVIATELGSIEPIRVDSIALTSGQRYDFVIDANRPIGKYYITFDGGIQICGSSLMNNPTRAILEYEGAEQDSLPFRQRESHQEKLIMFNSVSDERNTGFINIPISEIKMIVNSEDLIQGHPDEMIYLKQRTFIRKDSENEYFLTSFEGNPVTTLLNYISFKTPPIPIISMNSEEMRKYACNAESLTQAGVNCSLVPCECTHIYHIALGRLVEIHLLTTYDDRSPHPMHLHGNSLYVVGEGIFEKETSIEEYKALDKAGLISRNFVKAAKLDTVTPHQFGYSILRFRADNPGWWIFHCHLEFHVEWGMSVVLVVDDEDR